MLQQAETTAFGILAAISLCHALNDMQQALLPAIGLLAGLLPQVERAHHGRGDAG